MVTKFFHNSAEEDLSIEWDSKPQVFRAEAVTELTFDDDIADGMAEHYVRHGNGSIREVSREEARDLTGGVVGKPTAKSAKVSKKSSAPAGTEETKEPEAPGGDEGTEETEAKGKGKGK